MGEINNTASLRVLNPQYDPYSINLDKVISMESSGNPQAFNVGSQAKGLGQITPIALRDWNQMNPQDQYSPNQLYDPQINQKIAYWMLTERLPQQLRSKGVPVTLETVLQAYHDGAGNVAAGRIGPEGRGYIPKYKKG